MGGSRYLKGMQADVTRLPFDINDRPPLGMRK